MTDVVSFSDVQLQKIIDAVQSLKGGGVHWEQVIPVFVSAFLAMLVGIFLEYFKSSREKRRSEIQRQIKELQQINGTIIGIAYNIEVLLHVTFLNLLPHREQSNAAYNALQGASGDGEKIRIFALSLHRYPALMMTCPEMHFAEFDFLEKLPFLIERDPELVKKAGWLISFSREINNAIIERNKNIQVAVASAQQGGLNFYQLDNILQLQKTLSDAECVNALQLFDALLSIASSLQAISAAYTVPGKRSKLIPPTPLNDAIARLRAEIGHLMPAAAG